MLTEAGEEYLRKRLEIEESDLRKAIDEHFDDLHSTLYGKSFILISEGQTSRYDATNWLVGEFRDVLRRLGLTVTPVEPDPNQTSMPL